MMILAVALISAAIAYFRAGSMATPVQLKLKNLNEIRRENPIFFGVLMPLLTG